ncbi:hypothetical protein [Nocardiopsis sp. CA-288880]|uniref:hypothetical protein n=1 Tax=Nocardiopsis sp. CA-288880 TaxID=3239995 RepID=UPI003D98E348
MSRRHDRPRKHASRTSRPPRDPKARRCGKRWFKDRISAELAIANIRRYGRAQSERMPRRAYECPACKGWHLTSKTGHSRFARTDETRSGGSASSTPHRVGGGETGTPSRRLRTGQTGRAFRAVQGMEPWVAAYAEEHLADHGRGPTWRELEAVFGWNRWEGALAIRYLVDQGWLREESASPHLLPVDSRTAQE